VGLVLSVIVGLLLFAAVAIVMRPFLIVAALLTVPASLLLYRFHPGFRQWLDSSDEQQISYNGLHLATDIAVHPNHSWARVSGKDAIVGVDDLVQSTLGPVEAVDLPPLGSRIEQGQRLFQLRRGGRCVAVRAPVSGTIVAANEALLQQPSLVNDDPFGRGWVVSVKADKLRDDAPRLLRGSPARSWFRQEIDRLLSTVFDQAAFQPALPDGGTFVEGLYREIDDVAWKKLTESFFGVAPDA
jgi:glycine cleavage system H lipoate-binding protein